MGVLPEAHLWMRMEMLLVNVLAMCAYKLGLHSRGGYVLDPATGRSFVDSTCNNLATSFDGINMAPFLKNVVAPPLSIDPPGPHFNGCVLWSLEAIAGCALFS
jgi:hypothetical protein